MGWPQAGPLPLRPLPLPQVVGLKIEKRRALLFVSQIQSSGLPREGSRYHHDLYGGQHNEVTVRARVRDLRNSLRCAMLPRACRPTHLGSPQRKTQLARNVRCNRSACNARKQHLMPAARNAKRTKQARRHSSIHPTFRSSNRTYCPQLTVRAIARQSSALSVVWDRGPIENNARGKWTKIAKHYSCSRRYRGARLVVQPACTGRVVNRLPLVRTCLL